MKTRFLLAAVLAAATLTAGACNKEDASKGEEAAKAAEGAKDEAAKAGTAAKAEAQGAINAAAAEAAKAADEAEGGTQAVEGADDTAGKAKDTPPTDNPAAGGEADGEPVANEEPPAKQLNAAEQEAAKARAAQDERQQKLQSIYELGRKRDDASLAELTKIMQGDEEPGIRATAIRVLGRDPIESMVPTLKTLTQSPDMPVKMEAAIALYQWGEKKFAEPLLDELSGQGVALRRAFLTGRKDGKNQYDPSAKKFLKKGLDSDNVYTRLDAALGLYEMGEGKTALKVFDDVMKKEETFYVRMAALNYLRHLKEDPQINKIITAAKEDQDERVRERAKQILDEPAPNE